MSPKVSELKSLRGFTLMEVLVAMLVSGIMAVGITRFFKNSHRAYNIQAMLADRDQNAHYVLSRLSEKLMEAGANLPESGYPVIVPGATPSSGFSLAINPRGGTQAFYDNLLASQYIPVDDASAFKTTSSVLIVRADKSLPVEQADIATDFNLNDFVKGLKHGSSGQDSIRLSVAKAMGSGDFLYAYKQEAYSLDSTALTIGGMVLAEDIESVGLNFFDSTGVATTSWSNMHYAKLSVTARTDRPDPGSPGDGFRRVTVTSEIRLRNRP